MKISWEIKQVSDWEEAINLSNDGWELVAVVNAVFLIYIFKKPK